MSDLTNLVGNPDPLEWAHQFIGVVEDLGLVAEGGGEQLEELAMTWFANAIGTGEMVCEATTRRGPPGHRPG